MVLKKNKKFESKKNFIAENVNKKFKLFITKKKKNKNICKLN